MSGTIVVGKERLIISHKTALRFLTIEYHNRPAQDHRDVPLGLKGYWGQGLQAVSAHVLVHLFRGKGIGILILFPTAGRLLLRVQGGRLL